MAKIKILLMLGVSLAVLMAENNMSNPSAISMCEIAAMQKQIADLQKQLAAVVKQMNEAKAKTTQKTEHKVVKEQTETTPTLVNNTLKKDDTPTFDKGYIAVPGTTGAVKVSGMVKLDMIRDAKAYTSEQTNTSRLPYALQLRNPNLPNAPITWKEHFYMHAKQTKLRLDVIAKNSSGNDMKAFIESDFFSNSQWGNNLPNSPGNGNQFSTNYTPRLRHAVIEYRGLQIGHTTNTFQITETQLPSVDCNGITDGYGRHALIRYTHNLGGFSISAAAEHGRGDYITYTKTPTVNGGAPTTTNYSYNIQDSNGNLSKQTRPDLVLKLKYIFESGSVVAISGVNRDLRIKNNVRITGNDTATVNGKTYHADGWGVNLATKIMTIGSSFLTAGVTTGKGIGWYIIETNGRSAFFDPTAPEGQHYKTVAMTMMWLGYLQSWNPQWQSSIGIARINLGTQKLSDERKVTQWFEPGLDKTFNKFLVNTMYKPEENLQFGLEYFVLERKSTLNYKGVGQRLQFAANYKF